jgi:hypothetical protein
VVEIDVAAIFREVIKDAGKDLAARELADEDQLCYGTLTENDLKKVYNI